MSATIAIPGVISGTAIVNDLCCRIAEKLARSCDLREIDSYSGYSARVQIEIQLNDVYPVIVSAEVVAGKIDPQQPSIQIDLGSEVAGSEPQPSLERPVDPEGVVEAAPVKEKRYYTPRNATPLSPHANLTETG